MRERPPAVSTLHLVVRDLDVAAFEAAARARARDCPGDATAIALDGNGVRAIHGEALPGVHWVAADRDEAGRVLTQAGRSGGCTLGTGRNRPAPVAC